MKEIEQIVQINLRLIKCGSDLVEDGLLLILERMILEEESQIVPPLTEKEKAIKIDRIKRILKRIRMEWFPPSDIHPDDRSI